MREELKNSERRGDTEVQVLCSVNLAWLLHYHGQLPRRKLRCARAWSRVRLGISSSSSGYPSLAV